MVSFMRKLAILRYQYELNTAVSMLDPKEKTVVYSTFFAVIATACYSTYVFLPHYLRSLLEYGGIL